ncbi:developmental pluripotency-associated 5 protein [Pan paniscus]|uniref:developmental pluripotency-associated 5 protein n=1 Tax=Pan paniscus TaxID=9597 RepID=UPI00300748F0
MGTLPARRHIPPWVKVPEDLKDPEVFQVQTRLLKAIFGECAQYWRAAPARESQPARGSHLFSPTGPDGSRIPYIEQVSKAMLELKALESSDLTEVVVYGSYLYKLRTKWMLQSMAEWHRQRQERGERPRDWVRGTQARGGRFAPLLQPSPLSPLLLAASTLGVTRGALGIWAFPRPLWEWGPQSAGRRSWRPRGETMVKGGWCWTHWAGLSELSQPSPRPLQFLGECSNGPSSLGFQGSGPDSQAQNAWIRSPRNEP